MPDRELLILSDPPVIAEAGSGLGHGIVSGDNIHMALSLANRAHRQVAGPTTAPDDPASLRQSVNDLSDALALVVAELLQIERGLRHGRIAVQSED